MAGYSRAREPRAGFPQRRQGPRRGNLLNPDGTASCAPSASWFTAAFVSVFNASLTARHAAAGGGSSLCAAQPARRTGTGGVHRQAWEIIGPLQTRDKPGASGLVSCFRCSFDIRSAHPSQKNLNHFVLI